MTKPNTNIHGTAFEGKVLAEAIEQQQTLSSCKTAKYLDICNKSCQAITDALAELKAKTKSEQYQHRHTGD